MSLRNGTLPAELVEAMTASRGAPAAERWLAEASVLALRSAESWGICLDTVLTGGVMSLCVAGTDSRGNRVVVKVPSDASCGLREASALASWDGAGSPKVIDFEADTSVFVMEYLSPAHREPAAGEVFELAGSLHRHPPLPGSVFPELAENVAMRIGWAKERFTDPRWAHHLPDLAAAEAICRRLLETAPDPVLLHGDFQTKNLLPTATGLKTLDPMPCLGDPLFDAALWAAVAHHGHPVADILSRHGAFTDPAGDRRLLLWTWALAVIENRPLQPPGAAARQTFIHDARAAAAAALLKV